VLFDEDAQIQPSPVPDREAQVPIGVPAVIQFHELSGTRCTQDRCEL
jgi:hypothetical protein